MEKKILIAKDYSDTLGGRWMRLGPFSGEDFFNLILEPEFLKAREGEYRLIVELDGTKGYPSSFVDQSFGELARKYGASEVARIVEPKGEVFGWVADYIKDRLWKKGE